MFKLNRRIAAALTAAALVPLAVVGATTTTAQAAPCSPGAGYIAGYASSNTCAGFTWIRLANSLPINGCDSMGAGNNTGYVWNQSKNLYWAWTGNGCTGKHAPLYANTAGAMGGDYYKHVYSIQRKS